MTDETYTVELTPDHKDFSIGYNMGVDALEEIQKQVETKAADHEPLVLMGMLTVLMECAYRACVEEEDVDELLEIGKLLAKESMKESRSIY